MQMIKISFPFLKKRFSARANNGVVSLGTRLCSTIEELCDSVIKSQPHVLIVPDERWLNKHADWLGDIEIIDKRMNRL